MNTVIDAPQPTVLPVAGSDAVFPVRRIYCIGRNYAAHAREMGGQPDRDPPFFFCKPADAAFAASGETPTDWPYPPRSTDVHHEDYTRAHRMLGYKAGAQGTLRKI